jgi:hypothetical protein
MKRLLLASILASACGQGVGPSDRTTSGSDLVTSNGEQLNGEQLNGEQLNGEQLNGTNANGAGMSVDVAFARFDGAALRNGVPLDSLWLQGAVFHGVADGDDFSGTDFQGARFRAVTLGGAPVNLRVAGIGRKAPPDDDVWTYLLEFQSASGSWSPLCRNASGTAVAAIPVSGRWNFGRGVPGGGDHIADPGAFTFACEGLGAIAKCVFPIGYKPWKTVGGVSLAHHHQACVRALRADYCGDGTPWTQNGRRIDLYDGIGVQQMSRPFWLFEAEWDQDGANCVSKERVFTLRNVIGTVSPCILSKVSLFCGNPSDFQRGSLLMDRFQFFGISLF